MQLANTDELALGGIKPKLVVDVDGIERLVAWTLAARQKRAETLAQKKDAALLDDAADRVAAAETLDAVAIKHGVTLRFRAGTMDGAGGTMVALVDARTALATPTKRRALADENRRRADADEDASESASTAPLLRLDDETCAPPTSPLVKPRKRERSCWCRG